MFRFSTRHLLICTCSLLFFSHASFALFFSSPIYKYRDCASSLHHCNQSSTDLPKGASSLKVEAIKNMLKKSVFELKWNAYLRHVRCFQILIKSDGMQNICKILELTEQSNNAATNRRSFSSQIPLTQYNRNYSIELYTLPQMNTRPTVISKNLTVFSCTTWKASYQNFYDGERIVVTIEKAPQRCEFRNYSVIVFDEKSNQLFERIVYEKENSSKMTAMFSEPLCKGKYYIVVRKAWDRNQGCLDFDGYYRYCTGSKSGLETYIPRVPCKKDRTSRYGKSSIPETNGRPNVIIWIICGLIMILAILLSIYFLRSVQLKTKNRGIVLFMDDHQAHTEAVKRLADFLRECHLDISFASHFLKHHEENNQLIVLAEILKSDFVLLVISSAFQKRMEAWDKQQDYIEFFKEKNSNILTKHFLERIISWNQPYVCKFDHVTEHGSCFECSYSLPSDLNEMVKELETAGFNFSSFKYLKRKMLLNRFSVAVEKAADYERSNSEWFCKKYFCPKIIETEENSYIEHT